MNRTQKPKPTKNSEKSLPTEAKSQQRQMKQKLEKISDDLNEDLLLDTSFKIINSKIIEVGSKVRHTRFLNTNSPSGTFVLEILDDKALCKYVDSLGKTRENWFILPDLLKV
jgi:hypothetical protein